MGGEAVSVQAGSVVMMKTDVTWKQPLIALMCEETLMNFDIFAHDASHQLVDRATRPITARSGVGVRF